MALDNAKTFLFDMNFNEELRTKLKELLPGSGKMTKPELIAGAAGAARKLGYDFSAGELEKAMEEYGDNDALELAAVTSHAGVCTSTVQNRDTCAAAALCGHKVLAGGHIVHDSAGLCVAYYRTARDFDI